MYKTSEGFYKGIARVTRTGVYTYRNVDGTLRRELRHPDEVFKRESLDSLKMVPMTNNHPPDKLVNKDTAKSLSIGFTGETVVPDGKFVMVPVAITSADGVKAVEDGRQELSCGYEVELDEKPGNYNGEEYDFVQQNIRYNHVAIVDRGRAGADVRLNMDADDAVEYHEDFNPNHNPSNGEFSSGGGGGVSVGSIQGEANEFAQSAPSTAGVKILSVRKSISKATPKDVEVEFSKFEHAQRFQGHLASKGIKSKYGHTMGGRGGTVYVKGDEWEENIEINSTNLNTRSDTMPKVRLDNGLEYEAPQEVIVAFSAKQVELDGLKTKLDAAEKGAEKLRADADTAKEAQKALQTKVDGIPAAITAGVKARLALEKVANDTLDEETIKKLDGMSDVEIRKAVILSKFPEAKLDEKSDEYLNARFDAAVEAIKVDGTDDSMAKQRAKMGQQRGDSAASADCSEKKRIDMVKNLQDAYKEGNVNKDK